jgi:hypothetical protein
METITTDTDEYLKTLTPKEFKAYLIAKNHLGMSFDISRSIGFLKWLSVKRTK